MNEQKEENTIEYVTLSNGERMLIYGYDVYEVTRG